MTGPAQGRVAPVAGGALLVLLASSGLGDAGRAADVLAAHQALLAISAASVVALEPGELGRRLRPGAWLFAFVAFGWVLAPSRYRALLVLTDLVAAALVWWLAARASREREGQRLVVAGLLAGAALVAAVALAEWSLGQPPHGLYHNPRHASALISALVAALLAAAAAADPGSASRRLSLLAALPALAATIVLASRAAVVGLAAAALVTVVLLRQRVLLAMALALLALVVVVPNPLGERLLGAGDDPYRFERVRIWSAASRMARDHAFRGGVGLGSFERAARRYNFPVVGSLGRWSKYPNHAHNEALELVAEASLPGLLVLLLPLWAAGGAAARLTRRSAEEMRLAVPAAAALAALLGHAMVDAVLRAPANLYTFAALGGLLCGLRERTGEPDAENAEPGVFELAGRRWRGPVLVALGGLWLGASVQPWLADRAFREWRESHEEEWLGWAIRLAPSHAGYRLAEAETAMVRFRRGHALRDLDAAQSAFAAAVRLDPVDSRSWRAWASSEHEAFLVLLPATEIADRALEHYAASLERDPFNVFLRLERASLLGALGRSEAALADARQAVELEPSFRAGWEAVARAAAALGQAERAAEAGAEAEAIATRWAGVRINNDYESALVGGSLAAGPPPGPAPRD